MVRIFKIEDKNYHYNTFSIKLIIGEKVYECDFLLSDKVINTEQLVVAIDSSGLIAVYKCDNIMLSSTCWDIIDMNGLFIPIGKIDQDVKNWSQLKKPLNDLIFEVELYDNSCSGM